MVACIMSSVNKTFFFSNVLDETKFGSLYKIVLLITCQYIQSSIITTILLLVNPVLRHLIKYFLHEVHPLTCGSQQARSQHICPQRVVSARVEVVLQRHVSVPVLVHVAESDVHQVTEIILAISVTLAT